MLPGHQHTPGGSTDRRSRIVLGEAHTALGQCIDVRRLDECLTMDTDLAVTQIVGKDVDNIRWPLRHVCLGKLRPIAGQEGASR